MNEAQARALTKRVELAKAIAELSADEARSTLLDAQVENVILVQRINDARLRFVHGTQHDYAAGWLDALHYVEKGELP